MKSTSNFQLSRYFGLLHVPEGDFYQMVMLIVCLKASSDDNLLGS